MQATSKSRNDRDDTYLPGQSPKVPLQSWGIRLQPTGPESSFISVKQEICSVHSGTVDQSLSLSPEECLTVFSVKQEPEGSSWLVLPKFRDHFLMELVCPV